jgi:hypothetical protein
MNVLEDSKIEGDDEENESQNDEEIIIDKTINIKK